MELDPARMTLLTGFFETYLILNEEEERKLEEEMGKVDEKEAKRMIEITTSWEEKGKMKGRMEGKAEGKAEGQASILLRLLKKKFGYMPVEMENRVMSMPVEKLQELAEAIFDLETIDDVNSFISK
jgi:flagellar biosynthesis/type III secretory pathway protein FliH